MSTFEHNRAHYRIRYPVEVRPVYRTSCGEEHSVVDCSGQGLHYVAAGLTPEIGAATAGTIRFQTGDEIRVAGTVVRVRAGEVAVHLTERDIDWRVIFREQKFLLQRYPSSLVPA